MGIKIPYRFPLFLADFENLIVFKFCWGQWAMQGLQDDAIHHSPANFPPLEEYEWFQTISSEFRNHRDFFKSLHQPESTVSDVQGIYDRPPSTFSAKLSVKLRPLQSIWTDAIRLKCPICENISIASKSEHGFETSTCRECLVTLKGAHLLKLTFADKQGLEIEVDFTDETINVFFNKFTSSLIVQDASVYEDFLQTISWHVRREEIGRPFIQDVVLRKTVVHECAKYSYVSGLLKPVADGHR